VIRHRSKKTCTATRLLTLAAAICFPSLTLACALSESPLELDANAGEIVHVDCPTPSSPGSLKGAFRFLELRGTGRWAPSAFIGVRDDERNGKFRVFITQVERGGKVIAGYDYVLDGKLVLRETVVKEIPRTTAIPMAMTWTGSGRFSVSLFGEEPRTVETQLRAGVLFAAASSAKAKFALSAGSFL
jgi:hypothetical protein